MLSVEADQERSTWEADTAEALRPDGVEGGVLSVGGGAVGVVTVAGAERGLTLPAASKAATVYVYIVLAKSPVSEKAAVPGEPT